MNQLKEEDELPPEFIYKIIDTAQKLIKIRKQSNSDFLYRGLVKSLEDEGLLSSTQVKNYWETVNRWKNHGYDDNILDALIIWGLPKYDNTLITIEENFLESVLGYGFVEISNSINTKPSLKNKKKGSRR